MSPNESTTLYLPAKEVKRRRAITNSQRRALRTWFFDSRGLKTQADASVWWQATYGYYLNSSTVSEILSYKYNILDAESAPPPSDAPSLVGERKRHRTSRWEGLEEELLQWVFRHELAAGEGSVTGSMLRQRATKLWSSMPCYQGQPLPKWSEGWKTRFRARYNLRKWDMLWEAVTLATVDEPEMSSNTDTSVALPSSGPCSRGSLACHEAVSQSMPA